MSWISGPLLGFDTETTGVRVGSDRIVTAALVRRMGDETSVRTWLIDPGVEIPAGATAIHGITTEFARANGAQPAEALEEIASALHEALDADTPVVAFNAAFDFAVLDAELERYGLRSLADRLGRAIAPVIDPLVLDRAQDRYRRGKRTLADLIGVYGVSGDAGLHTAEVDVMATLDVLAAMVRRFPELGAKSLAELHDFQHEAHAAWATSFNEFLRSRGRVGDADPVWLPR